MVIDNYINDLKNIDTMIFVDCNTGNDDTGNGDSDNPFRTTNKALDKLSETDNFKACIFLSEGSHPAINYFNQLKDKSGLVIFYGSGKDTIIDQDDTFSKSDNTEFNAPNLSIIFNNMIIDFKYRMINDHTYHKYMDKYGFFSVGFKKVRDNGDGMFTFNQLNHLYMINCVFYDAQHNSFLRIDNFKESASIYYIKNIYGVNSSISYNSVSFSVINPDNKIIENVMIKSSNPELVDNNTFEVKDPEYSSTCGIDKAVFLLYEMTDLQFITFSNINPSNMIFRYSGNSLLVFINKKKVLSKFGVIDNEIFNINLSDHLTNPINPVDLSGYKFNIYKFDKSSYEVEIDFHVTTNIDEHNTEYSFKNGYVANNPNGYGQIIPIFPTTGKGNIESIKIEETIMDGEDVSKNFTFRKSTTIPKINNHTVYECVLSPISVNSFNIKKNKLKG